MKLGLIGRIDRRGIGAQTGEFWAHMGHPRTLIVEIDDGWPEDPDRFGYDDVLYVKSNLSGRLNERVLDENICRQFLDGLDVVFGVETTYEWEFVNWAREMGVEVWIQGNPEMYGHDKFEFPHPRWCWPTPWLLDKLPPGPILPVPCIERPNVAAREDSDALHVLHVAGRMAIGDRNGTYEFVQAIRSLHERVHVTIVSQDRTLPLEIRHGRNVTVDVTLAGVEDRWDMYVDQHVLVLPRKYGGLCLDAASRLTMVNGEQREIADVYPGDVILDGSPIPTTVTARQDRTVERHVSLSVRGREVRSSVDHLHLVASTPTGALRERKAAEVLPGEWMMVARPPSTGRTWIDMGEKPRVRALRFWPREVQLDEGWARLIGLWLAEGHRGVYAKGGRDRGTPTICWNFGAHEEWLADEVVGLLANRGIVGRKINSRSAGTYGESRTCIVRVRNLWLYELFERLGLERGSHSKRAPDIPGRLVPALIGGWLDGDGNVDGRTVSGWSRSTEMIGDLWRLALKAGVLGGISHRGERLDFTGGAADVVARWCRRLVVPERLKAQPEFTNLEVEGGWMVRVRSVSVVDEPLDVVAIETESQHYVAENIVTHNCLPALEAMSCGLAVVMSNQSPNEIWPGPRIESRRGRNVYTPAGRVETRECHVLDIAKAIDELARNREILHDELEAARDFAAANTWAKMRPLYDKVLADER